MSIVLYEHNKEAYDSTIKMLNDTGKAAVIHPTGTGKSFIAFKLCEDNPNSKICWLSPSEYIFKTQCENLVKTGGTVPDNILFYTYAKIMNMKEEEISEIKPNFIILDEFHRCGAEQWGTGVQLLLKCYPDALLLGLSATAVRYLDNQRDMSDELFDGNVSSEMTLGEAIVRGILNPPKYVLSIFSYQKELERYSEKVHSLKNKAVQDRAEKYLEALRRSLNKAEGLDVVFDKNMENRNGKYIVFCANIEHMREMISLVPEWFSKIDSNPNVYIAYSNDLETSKSFAKFKDDTSEHLKLLYCIDMLNEGVHIDDIDGVILLRPTVSPIIYKQQIGRALSTGKKDNSVIFDIVLNIDNLYSIGEIEEEMQISTAYYRSLGEEDRIVNEHFEIIDEVKNCRELFDKLENILTASWDIMYECAKEFFKKNGNLEVPARYKTSEGYALGHWIHNQRSIYKGILKGTLTKEQISKLDAIGMRWMMYTDYTWEVNFNAAKSYYEKNGNLDVSTRYITEDGIPLGGWLNSLRTWERAGAHPKYLTQKRKEQLESIGMIWNKIDFYWEKNYLAAAEYYREYGNLLVPAQYVSPDGVCLGSWIARLRGLRSGKIKRGTPPSAEQIERLNLIGMDWNTNLERMWNEVYSEAQDYYKKNGNLSVPNSYRTKKGFHLAQWINNQRKYYKAGTLLPERKKLLDAIGFVWEKENRWDQNYKMVVDYCKKHNIDYIPQDIVVDGVWLGKWVASQKKYMAQGKLTTEQITLLHKLPLDSLSQSNRHWECVYEDAYNYFKKNGNLRVPKDYIGDSGTRLGAWLIAQRRKYRLGELSEEKINKLNEIHFEWIQDNKWTRGFKHAQEYYNENGDLNVKHNYRCKDGYSLGIWLNDCRNAYNKQNAKIVLTAEQVKSLENIGMNWEYSATAKNVVWNKHFEELLMFYEKHGCYPKYNSKDPNEKKLSNWIFNQRKSYKIGALNAEKVKKLSKVGITEEWLSGNTSQH